MNGTETKLKKQHHFLDFLYWIGFLAVPIIAAGTAIFKASVLWLFFYIFLIIGATLVIYKYYCSHCPHYTNNSKTTQCMFFWGVPKIFTKKKGPLNLFEKVVTFGSTVFILFFPVYWLVLQPGLMVIYFLSFIVFFSTVRRNECGRCIYKHCPMNQVTDSDGINE